MFARPVRQHSVLNSDAEAARRQEFMVRRALNRTTDPFLRLRIQEEAERQVARNRRIANRNGR